jgi:hypothetical protein
MSAPTEPTEEQVYILLSDTLVCPFTSVRLPSQVSAFKAYICGLNYDDYKDLNLDEIAKKRTHQNLLSLTVGHCSEGLKCLGVLSSEQQIKNFKRAYTKRMATKYKLLRARNEQALVQWLALPWQMPELSETETVDEPPAPEQDWKHEFDKLSMLLEVYVLFCACVRERDRERERERQRVRIFPHKKYSSAFILQCLCSRATIVMPEFFILHNCAIS